MPHIVNPIKEGTVPDAYKAVLTHGDSLASGRHIAPFDEVPADALTRIDDDQLHPHDQALIDEGKLLPIEEPKRKPARAKETNQ
jgi:hypothetical protein